CSRAGCRRWATPSSTCRRAWERASTRRSASCADRKRRSWSSVLRRLEREQQRHLRHPVREIREPVVAPLHERELDLDPEAMLVQELDAKAGPAERRDDLAEIVNPVVLDRLLH